MDEIDAVGGRRSAKDQQFVKMTLNQLLVELDGFNQNEGVVVIAATNFPEMLDSLVIKRKRRRRRTYKKRKEKKRDKRTNSQGR